MTCQVWNAFFDWAWPWITVSVLVWALMETLKERWSVAANLRALTGLFFAGTLIVTLVVAVLNSGVQSPCSAGDANKVERIHQPIPTP